MTKGGNYISQHYNVSISATERSWVVWLY